jgi:hypothetical protein
LTSNLALDQGLRRRIENFIHSGVFSGEINPQVMQMPKMSIVSIQAIAAVWAKAKGLIVVVALLILTPFPNQAQTVSSVPTGWQKAEACGVAFYLPPDMKASHKGELGLDRCVEWFVNETNTRLGLKQETRLGGDIWFTIRDGKLVRVPKTDKADPE